MLENLNSFGIDEMNSSAAIKFTKSQLQGLASNLSILIEKNNLTEAELALALEIPSMTVRRLASGETVDPHISTLKKIANYFEVSIDSLIETTNLGSITTMRKKNMPVFVPILDWNTVSKIDSLENFDLSSWQEWQPVVLGKQHSLGENAFAIEGKPSMMPRFPMGTLFVIDPSVSPIDGDLVLIKMKQDSGLSIREISIDPPKWQLKPTIPGSETIFYAQNEHAIVGTVMVTLLYSRR